ncbi:MAG: transcriptional regulator, partial [Alphaproteobacteria bacterium]|nr:transcriptional regulator [Alphaproteobacteria bacterium]
GQMNDGVPSTEALRMTGATAQRKIAEWHAEAIGYKIRYVPCTIPDLLRIEEVSEYEFRAHEKDIQEAQDQQVRKQLSHTSDQLPSAPTLETDVEVCMPLQTLELFYFGRGIWDGLSADIRVKQLEHIAQVLDQLYPTFRLFIYDQREIYSSPYTLFGPLRAAIYLGNMYMVVNSVEHIKAMSKHFDMLIRSATYSADRAVEYIEHLLAQDPGQ